MQEFTIRKETNPSRCEICHRSDLFDPSTGECSRCKNIAIPLEKLPTITPHQRAVTQTYKDLVAIGAVSLGVLAFVPGILFPLASLVLGVFGLIAGLTSLGRIRARRETLSGEVFAYIGIYCGSLAVILGLFRFLFALYKS